ncbi:MAG: isoprenylcysteine carboxylmethyltransferase family protein [Methanoregula sp.]
MDADLPAYGLRVLVIVNSLIFIGFAFAFIHPRTKTGWESLGAFSAFIVALFAEMYGFPLTIFLLSGWPGNVVPDASLFTHDAGHLWYTLSGMTGDPHTGLFPLVSYAFILTGLFILMSAWNVLYRARQEKRLAVTGMSAYVRHPRYLAFVLIMIGFLVPWPAILTLILFPWLIWRYAALAKEEESEVVREFGGEYTAYAAGTPGWFPGLSGRGAAPEASGDPALREKVRVRASGGRDGAGAGSNTAPGRTVTAADKEQERNMR